MTKIYIPSKGPADWQGLLGDPVKHWRTGFSARTLAHCWESANGFPREIERLLQTLGRDPKILIAIPEHKVPLPGSTRGDSQNDLFVIARIGDSTVAVTIEGKAEEPFDQPLWKWLEGASKGKKKRLTHICELLGLSTPLPGEVYYQLLHRTASAVIEARRFKTDAAAMIVHSFSQQNRWFDEFSRFASLFGKIARTNELLPVGPRQLPPVYIGWASGDRRHLAS